jgi:hypothetical protein
MDSLLQRCRENFGAAPRSFPLGLRRYLTPGLPRWTASDPLFAILDNRNALLRRGRVVWGVLIHSNEFLFEPATGDAPALAVWSDDEEFNRNPHALTLLARRIREVGPQEGELRDVAAFVLDSMRRTFQFRLPESLAENAYLSSLLVIRRQLPMGFLSSSLLPLIVLPEENPYAMILPGKFWPDALKDR